MENKARLLSNDELVSGRAVSELQEILNSDSRLVLPVVFYHSTRLMLSLCVFLFHRLQLQSDAAVIISNFEFIKNKLVQIIYCFSVGTGTRKINFSKLVFSWIKLTMTMLLLLCGLICS